jgi:hypothetical protein
MVHASTTLADVPIPSATTNSGAKAIRGIAFAASKKGPKMRSSVRSIPRATPTTTPARLAATQATRTAIIVALVLAQSSPERDASTR